MIAYLVEGFRVTCSQDARQHRTWHCGCSEFERRHREFGEGFCAHTALAIERAIEGERIQPDQRAPRGGATGN